ncbi:hypothetical protein NKJ84_26530 [Mesorhizobium sp. M0048]|uniref:hypothetical protein n=1 Tax=Mesorhizobium sp. M0048 TaxID=2956860 RepID=UPI0033397A07
MTFQNRTAVIRISATGEFLREPPSSRMVASRRSWDRGHRNEAAKRRLINPVTQNRHSSDVRVLYAVELGADKKSKAQFPYDLTNVTEVARTEALKQGLIIYTRRTRIASESGNRCCEGPADIAM